MGSGKILYYNIHRIGVITKQNTAVKSVN